MTMLATDWLALAVLLCLFAWWAGRRFVAVLLPFAAVIAAFAVYLPTGTPRFTLPPAAEYTVLGAKIVPNVAIWVLLDDNKGAEPRYYRLPYTNEAANQLQQAQDDAAGGGPGVKLNIDGEGGQSYEGDPPVTGEPPKAPEQPAVTLP